jgi:hypothetical protein
MFLLYTTGKLTDLASIDFESVTGAFIQSQIESMVFSPPVYSSKAFVDVTNQSIQQQPNSTTTRQRRRSLQGKVELQVSFNVRLLYQSIKQDYNPGVWVGDAFNSADKRRAYISRLQQTNSKDFVALQDVKTMVNGAVPTDVTAPIQDGTNKQNSGGLNLWVIVGTVAGACVLILILGAILLSNNRRKRNNHNNSSFNNDVKTGASPSTFRPFSLEGGPESSDRLAYSAEIDVDRQDDVSTLGDPVLGGHTMMMLGAASSGEDMRTETDDYDYNRQFLGIRSASDLESIVLGLGTFQGIGRWRGRRSRSNGLCRRFFL